MNSNKIKISYLLPSALKNEMNEMIIKEGYSLRQKSKWIEEAIEILLSYEACVDQISYSYDMENLTAKDSASLPLMLKREIDKVALEVKKINPEYEGLQSVIIRAAIQMRIEKNGSFGIFYPVKNDISV